MKSRSPHSERTVETAAPAYPPTWSVFLGVAVIIWIYRYWQSGDFGLYEDDLARIPAVMETSLAGLLDHVGSQFRMNGQGRPFNDGPILTLSFIAARMGGLFTAYVFGFLVVTLNGCLAFLLLRRLQLGALFAVVGTLVWILYPVDTNTQLYLTLTLGGQFSITVFLLASLAYLSGRRVWAYPLIAISLFCYETVYPVFFAIPLLAERWDRRIWKPLLVHAGVLAAMVAGAGVLRTTASATVIPTPSLEHALTWPIRQMWVGVQTALTTLVARPVTQLFEASGGHWLFLAPLAVALLLLLNAMPGRAGSDRGLFRRHGRVALVGLVMLAFSYALAFTVNAEARHGRETRVHMPGVIGASLLAGSLLSGALWWMRGRRGRLAAEAAAALLLTGMAGYALKIQDDYVDAWAYQKAFVADVLRLCPDLGDGSIVVLNRWGFKHTEEIAALGWDTVDYPKLLYRMPREWRLPPVIAFLQPNWRQEVAGGRPIQELFDYSGMEQQYSRYRDAEFILLEFVDGELRRLSEPVEVGGAVVTPKPRSEAVLTKLPPRLLHSLMELRPGERPADYTF